MSLLLIPFFLAANVCYRGFPSKSSKQSKIQREKWKRKPERALQLLKSNQGRTALPRLLPRDSPRTPNVLEPLLRPVRDSLLTTDAQLCQQRTDMV